jgi:signal transduction histidine kinase
MAVSGPHHPGISSQVPVERALGWLRLGACIFGAAQTAIFPFATAAPPGARYAEAASYLLSVVIGIVGVFTLLALRSGRPPIRRLALITFAADAVVVIGFAVCYAFEAFGTTHLLILVIPLEGALKFGAAGAAWSLGAVAVGEASRNALRTLVWGHDPLWNHTSFLVGLAVILGGVTALLSRTAERRRLDAEREAARARQHAADAEASRNDLETLHRVILAGIGERPHEALERMVSEVEARLGYDYLAVVLIDDDGVAVPAIARGGDPELLPNLVAEPGGPTDRVLNGGPAELVTGGDLDGLSHSLPDTAVEIVAPIRVRGTVIGALVAEHRERSPAIEDLPLLQRLADQMGLVIEGARAYERERVLAERYQELDRLKTDFVAITSHELRTPLTAILGFAETLNAAFRLTEEQRVTIEAGLLRQARRLRRLVEDLRTISLLDTGTLEIQLRPTDVAEAVSGALESTGVTARVQGPAGAHVVADPVRLEQVLTNLLTNAVEHGDRDSVRISWTQGEGTVEVRLSDAGPGVPAGRRERIFERFVQGRDVLTHQRGSGLGLAIARELTEAMGGTLELADTHEGATFVATLAAADEPVRSAEGTG